MPASMTPLLAVWLTEAAEPLASESSFALDLAVWKWVVFIGAGAVVVTWVVRRVAEVVVARKTRNIIEQVVGKDAGGPDQGWDEPDDQGDEP